MVTIAALALLAPTSWDIVWRDEFNRDGRPDPRRWVYEVGYLRNKETQYYTDDRKENARIEGGNLVIEARKDGWDGKPVTSASLTTQGRYEFTYGKIEVRAKVPGGKGTWPAIWTLGTNISDPAVSWPLCGEIDLMEFVGMDPNGMHHNVHTKAANHTNGGKTGIRWEMTPAPSEGFHVYEVEYDPKQIIWRVDGIERHRYVNPDGAGMDAWPFDKPQYLLLNLAIGGAWGGQQGIDDSIYPAKFLVDYVRISKPK